MDWIDRHGGEFNVAHRSDFRTWCVHIIFWGHVLTPHCRRQQGLQALIFRVQYAYPKEQRPRSFHGFGKLVLYHQV